MGGNDEEENRRVVIAGGALVLGGASAAWAAIPDGDDGEFHACVKSAASSSGHDVRIIDKQDSETCPSGWTEKVWSQAGPAGPEGPAGPPGPALAFYTRGADEAISAIPTRMMS